MFSCSENIVSYYIIFHHVLYIVNILVEKALIAVALYVKSTVSYGLKSWTYICLDI